MIPQIIILVLSLALLVESAFKHGEMRKMQEYDFWDDLTSLVILIVLLYLGEFFDVILNKF